jgi:hypothetical protein
MTDTVHTTKPHALGSVIHGRCVTMQTEHTGNVVARNVAARWADGTPRTIRYTIAELGTGRRIIIEPGTDAPGPAR